MDKYNEDVVRKEYSELTKLLIKKHMTITTMESATAGLISSLITDTEGSSAVLKGAFVTYCNEAKVKQGVPREVIDRYTVYSEETAQAMAKACRKAYSADIGIGITGTMGNIDPENPQASEPGKIYLAVSTANRTDSKQASLPPMADRYRYKLAAASEAYDLISRVVKSCQGDGYLDNF